MYDSSPASLLHKVCTRTVSHKRLFLKKLVVSTHIQENWVEQKSAGEKDAQATGKTSALRKLSNKTHSRTCESLTRTELRQESRNLASTFNTYSPCQANPKAVMSEVSYMGWGEKKTVISFCIKWWNQRHRVKWESKETQNWSCIKSNVNCPHGVGCHTVCQRKFTLFFWCPESALHAAFSRTKHLSIIWLTTVPQ